MNEKNLAASSYILEFYKNVQLFTITYVTYREMYKRFENKLHAEKPTAPTPEEKDVFQNTINNIRYYIRITFFNYRSLSLIVPLAPNLDKELRDLYNKFDNADGASVDLDLVDRYNELINAYIVHDTLNNLIKSSSLFASEILNNQNG